MENDGSIQVMNILKKIPGGPGHVVFVSQTGCSQPKQFGSKVQGTILVVFLNSSLFPSCQLREASSTLNTEERNCYIKQR